MALLAFLVSGLIGTVVNRGAHRWFAGPNHIGDYMRRWFIKTPWFSVRIHNIRRSDEDRALHDHPWPFVSLILWGGYREITDEHHTSPTYGKWYGPGSILYRPAAFKHRLLLPHGHQAWTLVVTGPKQRSWGFDVPGVGWLHWRKAEAYWAGFAERS
jgi:hypothetical protein